MGRAPCCDKANVKKGPWSPEEDARLKEYIEKYGTGGNWIALPQKVGMFAFLFFLFSFCLRERVLNLISFSWRESTCTALSVFSFFFFLHVWFCSYHYHKGVNMEY